MSEENSLVQFEKEIKYLRRLNSLSTEKIDSLFEKWFQFIIKYPIECIDITYATSNNRLIKSLLTKYVNTQTNKEAENDLVLKSIIFVSSCYINDLSRVQKYLENPEDIDINFNKFKDLLPPLHISCDQGNLELTKILLASKKIDINLLSNAKPHNSALHKLCEAASSSLNSRREAILKLLIDSNIDINIRNQFNETALHICVYYENCNLAKLLIKNYASVNIQTIKSLNSRTCLHYCANLDSDNLELFKIITNQSKNYDLLDSSGENILQIANKKGNLNICKYIINSNMLPIYYDKELMLSVIYSSIEFNCFQNFKFYISIFKFKLDIDLFMKYAKLSKNLNQFLKIVFEENLIESLENNDVGSKVIEYISKEHLEEISNLMKDEKMKYCWYLNSKKLFEINNFYLESLIYSLKYIFKFDYKYFQKTVENQLYLYKIVNLDLDYFDFKLDENCRIILYNDESLLQKFLQFVILSGRLKQNEIPAFISHLIENVFNKLKHSYADLLNYLYYQRNELLTLKQLCRIKIRLHLISQNESIVSKLNYPCSLQRYLNFYDIFC